MESVPTVNSEASSRHSANRLWATEEHATTLMAVLLLAVISGAVGCAADTSSVMSCDDLALELAACVGDVPVGFIDHCVTSPETAARTVDGACLGDGKSDLIDGWLGDGERCFNFNFECAGDLTCRPELYDEQVHACRAPGLEHEYCDDDDDCGASAGCVNEDTLQPLGLSWDRIGLDEAVPNAGVCVAMSGAGGRCYNFNFECSGGLVCRPYSQGERDQFCLPRTDSEACDDDDDCVADDYYCMREAGIHAGTCKRPLDADERCFNYNFECRDGLICRPVTPADDIILEDQFCTEPVGEGERCDDHYDCIVPLHCGIEGTCES